VLGALNTLTRTCFETSLADSGRCRARVVCGSAMRCELGHNNDGRKTLRVRGCAFNNTEICLRFLRIDMLRLIGLDFK
jgi:hypothetical protein